MSVAQVVKPHPRYALDATRDLSEFVRQASRQHRRLISSGTYQCAAVEPDAAPQQFFGSLTPESA